MARIILHIGTHKTATTTVQDTLAANRDLLARHGIVYPKLDRFAGHHTLATQWIDLPEIYTGRRPAAEMWQQIVDEHAGTDATVFVSSEELSRWRPRAVDMAELARVLAPFEQRTVICTLRNQISYIQSIFLQISRDYPAVFAPFLNAALSNLHATGVFLDYGALYDHLLTGFAPEEIAFLSFEKAVRAEGGIVGALFARLGLPAVDLVPLRGDSNVSPDPLAAWAASQITAPAPAALVEKARAVIVATFGEVKTTLYTRAEVAQVIKCFAPANAAFEARYRAVDPGFDLAPLALSPDLFYRGQLTPAFWDLLGQPRAETVPSPAAAPQAPPVRTEPRPAAPAPADDDLARRADALLARVSAGGGLPRWPAAALQKQYAGNHGPALMRSTLRLIEALERDGALQPGWRGLDYGCGWGRVASVLRTKGSPEQLDLCDAWPNVIASLPAAGFGNRIFPVSEVLAEGEVAPATYDFVLAFSVFTHLGPDTFENNLRLLLGALKPEGRLYLTVRHADFLPRAKAGPADLAAFGRDGFWFRPSRPGAHFGVAVVRRDRLEALAPGSLDYLGEIDPCQHLYALGPAPAPRAAA
jgi:SAM-dependent methyltransferase